ncbi:MAG: hypothetical protein ACFFBH_16355 [Promethearchaeota archaeon]
MIHFEKFIEYYKGSIPLIISVPHGGTRKIKIIPTRKEGIVGIDKKTREIASELIRTIEMLYQSQKAIKKTPSYIVSTIHRSKIDINRKEAEAYDNSSILAKELYRYYHNKVKDLIFYNLLKFNRSIMIDIHGFEKINIPMGYRDVDIILGTNNLETLYSEPIAQRYWGNNLRGKIIKTFVKLGVSIAPGRQRRKEYALKGGYITRKYGASKIKGSQTIQIEFSDKIRLHNGNLRKKIIDTLANLLFEELTSIIL